MSKFVVVNGKIKRKIKNKVKNAARAVLFGAALFGVSLCPAFAYDAAYVQEYQLAPGVTYYDAAAENATGIQRAHYIEYTPGDDVQPVVGYGKGFYGRSSITYVADYLESELGMQVLAGFNGDFYNTGTGVPIGMVIDNGRLISSPGGAYAVGFREDGSYIFGKPKLNMTISDGSKSVTVENFNKTRSSYTVNLYDYNWGTETRLSGAGTNVLLEKLDPDDEVAIGCNIKMRVVSVREESASTPIGENQMVLTVAATGDATKVGVFYAGQEVELNITADDEAWNDAVYAVGGKSLILDGQVSAGDSPSGNAARTAIGFRDDGTMVFFENDGRLKNFSVGLSPAALGEEMLALGVQNAINLDGGGSSVMGVKRFGYNLAVVNSPSDGKARMVANHIFLVNRQDVGTKAALLQIKTQARYVLAGSTVQLDVYALNEALAAANLPGEVSWQVERGDGEFVELEEEEGAVNAAYLTAGDDAGLIRVSASSGRLAAYQNIYVLSSVSNLAITSGGEALSTLNVTAGDQLSLAVSGVYKNQAVAVDNGGIKWSVSGDIGSIDDEGNFRAGGRDSSGTIIAQAGNTKATLPVVLADAGSGPSIVAVSLPTQLAEGEVGEFSWRVTTGFGSSYPDESRVAVLLDGSHIYFDYDYKTGVVSAQVYDLAPGTHRLTLIAEDDNGELARKSITVQVGDAAGSLSYTDVSAEHWAADFIAYLEARGLMQGETNAAGELTFNPGRNLTRAEFAVIAARYLGLDCSQPTVLPYADRPDVPAWAIGAVRAVYTAGIMQGQTVGDEVYFYPRSNITRQEAMAVISRILGEGYVADEQEFADSADISAWAKADVDKLVTLGFVGGYEDGTIQPLANITRAEIAKVLYNLY